MAAVVEDYAVALESMELDYDDKCNEAVELKAELKAAQIEAQQLRLRLRAAAAKGGAAGSSSTINGTTKMPSPSEQSVGVELRAEDFRRLLVFLVERIDLSKPPTVFNVVADATVDGRAFRFDRVAQWCLRTMPWEPAARAGTGLRLTVPAELQCEIAALLAATQANGYTAAESNKQLAEIWDMVVGDVRTVQVLQPQPAILLARRNQPGPVQGVLVASWPVPEVNDTVQAPDVILQPPRLAVDVPAIGERVEILFEGQWYTGVLQSIDKVGMASVKCDVDAPGILTVASIANVRRPSPVDVGRPAEGRRNCFSHKRAKSSSC